MCDIATETIMVDFLMTESNNLLDDIGSFSNKKGDQFRIMACYRFLEREKSPLLHLLRIKLIIDDVWTFRRYIVLFFNYTLVE